MSYDLPFVGRLHSLLEGGWMSRFTNDLSSSSSHGTHHRPSLWYIVWGKNWGGSISYGIGEVEGRETED